MKMRESRVLKKLRAGEIVSSFKVNLSDAQVSELASICGFDCIWVDREHQAQDWSVIGSHVWATKAHDVDLLVRVSRGSYSDYIKPMELDATGIMVPHVMGIDDARKIIQSTRFHPLGRRPVDGGGADGLYTNMRFKDYLNQANEQRFVVLQIEDPEPLADLEAIADLEGYDMLFFGPGDFSQGIGAPGDWENKQLINARIKVAEIANKYGKFAGTTGSIDHHKEFIDMGYNFIAIGADVVGISNYCHNLLNKFNSGINKEGDTNTGIY